MGVLGRWLAVGAVIGAVGATAACGQESRDGGEKRWEGEGPYTIVATTGMVADTVRNIVGEGAEVAAGDGAAEAPGGREAAGAGETKVEGPRAEVVGLMGPGVDPHLFKPTRSDMITLSRADVIFYNGLLLEGKMTDALIRVARGGTPVYAVTEEIPESSLLEPAEMQGHFDPHVWMDPGAWRKVAKVIADRLSVFDPGAGEMYKANFERYDAELAALEAWAERVLATVPEESRVLVTAHDAFNYFGRRFGYEVVGIQGISTESEAGIKDMENLVNLLVDRKVKAVFVESTVSERNVEALIAGAKRRGHEVRIGGKLYSDAMGEEGTYEGTYIGMIDHNVTTIVKALGGEVEDGGMQGKLAGAAAAE